MSILTKPYTIAVYDDVLKDGVFEEVRLGVIGTEKMTGLGRAQEPNLIRNINGQNKFSFKMHKRYIDTITGEEVENPFVDWLVSERKVKLNYNGKWYDFIVKDIYENSSNYLYTYQLEDANVQELSKNGFGVTLDAALMNNIGTAVELGAYVMEQTDWSVDGDVTVQTVDEALVYVQIPGETTVKHIKDQIVGENGAYSQGVTLYDDITFDNDTTVLAFYSSCKNKPHRFQFIYSPNGYTKDEEDNYAISRKDNRIIDEKDCQYYIDFDNPETAYVEHDTVYDLYLPKDWKVVEQGTGSSGDTTISSWYRGARYGYAQQAIYVPLLEQYCQKFKRDETISLYDSGDKKNIDLHMSGSDGDISGSFSKTGDIVTGFNGTKSTEWTGIKLLLDYNSTDTYEVSYTLKKSGGALARIGGHNASFDTKLYVYKNADRTEQAYYTTGSYIQVDDDDITNPYYITAYYTKKTPSSKDWSPYIFIQPNRGLTTEVNFEITDLVVKQKGDYLGYTTSEFISPTLVQNCITNHKFESDSGWTVTASTSTPSADRGDAINVYGRFISDDKFVTITEDFLNGTYAESNTYTPYMKLLFKKNNQFVLNSGIYDNRSMIKNMPKDEEWVLDYKIVNSAGKACSGNFEVSLGEYIYNTTTGGYNQRNGLVNFSASSPIDFNNGKRVIFKVESTTYDTDSFKKNSKIYLKISPKSGVQIDDEDGTSFYIEKIALYRKSLDKNNEIIYPDYEEECSSAAETWIDKSTLEHKYIYFHTWHVDGDNPNVCTEKDKLPIITKNTLEYSAFKPVYNEGAAKIRTVTAKESNYFNVLQSIAETFEQWLVVDIERETDGSIKPNGKKIHFRNYRGGDNYACFRYGVNLKNIQRTKSSKNIATKLIVKQNSNELAENGFCTIQRAGANPTGENYIYDFQYYQNTDIMDTSDYLNTAYYLEGAIGPDAELWDDPSKVGYLYSEYESHDQFIVQKSTTNQQSPRIKVSPGETIKVIYTISASDKNVQTGTACPLVHQFYKTATSGRDSYQWADCGTINTVPESGSNAYKNITTEPTQYETTVTIPAGIHYYTTGYRATGAVDSYLGTYRGNITFTLVKIQKTDEGRYPKGTTLNGYYPRLKKINDVLLPINEEIIGLQADLVKRKAELEVAEATYEAATSGIEQTEEDFRALTGVSPKEAQSGKIIEVKDITVTSQDAWCEVDKSERTGYTDGIKSDTQSINIALALDNSFVEEYCEVIADQGTTVVELTSGAKKITKNTPYTGLYIKNDWEDAQLHDETDGDIYRTYKLTYELEWIDGNLINIGCHNSWFATSDFCITITDEDGEVIGQTKNNSICYPKDGKAFQINTKYLVTIEATRNPGPPEPKFSKDLWIQPNRGDVDGSTEVTCKISKIKLYKQLTSGEAAKGYDRTAYISINAKITLEGATTPIERTFEMECAFPAGQTNVIVTQPVSVIDTTRSDVQKYLTEYTTYFEKLESSSLEKTNLTPIIANKENAIKEKEAYRKQLLEYKTELNKLFFKRYSRFIQEGTWISEEYADDEKYYADALSVLYNSCYPQVAYSINVLELSAQPGYELFSFEPGEKTWAIDPEFFGEDYREEVIITELSEMLDNPSKNNVKVQNFKNQFQDLFQKITATVQQTQYNVGSYKKGEALVEASAAKKSEFVTNAINAAQTYLNAGQTVKSGTDGITITDDSNAKRQLRLVGGAILFSAEDPETKETRWRTGLTNEGISADLIKAGRINTEEIQIMAGDQAAFRWDVYGISAYDALWTDSGSVSTVGNVNTNKFVRFDKHGIYGIDGTANGATWHPTGLAEIDNKATFALTWQGLKVTGDDGITARIGYNGNTVDDNGTTIYGKILNITDASQKSLMSFSNDGTLKVGGWSVSQDGLESINEETATYSLRRTTSMNRVPRAFLSARGRKIPSGTNTEGEPVYENSWGTENIVFKAGDHFHVTEEGAVYASAGEIGGWATRNTSLIGGYHGVSLMGLFTNYQGLPDSAGNLGHASISAGGSESKNDWRILIGDSSDYKFGIDRSGAVYASAGKIGGIEIGDLTKNANQNLFDPNLLQTYNVESYTSLTSKSNGWNMVSSSSGNAGIKFIDSTFTLNQDYVLTYKFKKTSGTLAGIGGHSSAYTTTKFIFDGVDLGTNPQGGWSRNDDSNEHTVEWHFKKTSTIGDSNLYIQINRSRTVQIDFDIWDVKLELGDVATAWTPSATSTITNMAGAFSWKFSPTEGMFMWNGPQHESDDIIPGSTTKTYGPTRGAVFAVYKDENVHKLSMRGHIEADSGQIGGWTIEDSKQYKLYHNSYISSTVLYNSNSSHPSAFYGTKGQGTAVKAYLTDLGVHVKTLSYKTTADADDFVSWSAIVQCAKEYVQRARARDQAMNVGNYSDYDFDFHDYSALSAQGFTGWVKSMYGIGNDAGLLFVNGSLILVRGGNPDNNDFGHKGYTFQDPGNKSDLWRC